MGDGVSRLTPVGTNDKGRLFGQGPKTAPGKMDQGGLLVGSNGIIVEKGLLRALKGRSIPLKS
jgi:hypothetical protein